MIRDAFWASSSESDWSCSKEHDSSMSVDDERVMEDIDAAGSSIGGSSTGDFISAKIYRRTSVEHHLTAAMCRQSIGDRCQGRETSFLDKQRQSHHDDLIGKVLTEHKVASRRTRLLLIPCSRPLHYRLHHAGCGATE